MFSVAFDSKGNILIISSSDVLLILRLPTAVLTVNDVDTGSVSLPTNDWL